MSGFVDFLVAKKTETKAILKNKLNACEKWPSVSWKWCFQGEMASLLLILRQWPKKTKLKEADIETARDEIAQVATKQGKSIDEETSAMMGETVYSIEAILYQLPAEMIDLLAQTDEKNDLAVATLWHKYFDHWPAEELSELVRDLRKLCAAAKKGRKCVFLLDSCAY